MPTAVITGATSGLGLAFAAHLARDGYDLTLVARIERDLESTADRLRHSGHRITTMAADLATSPGSRRLTGRPARSVPDLLVDNAGIALAAPSTGDPGAEDGRLQLNIGCVLRTTQTVLPAMMRRGSGTVINVASVAAHGPTWLAGTYPAGKSRVLAFTESIARSAPVRSSGVRVVALLSGYMRTAFHGRAGLEVGHLPSWMWLNSEQVVTATMRDLATGRPVSPPGRRYRACAWGLRHLPRTLTAAFSRDLGRSQPILPQAGVPHRADTGT
ncbi:MULTISPECIES: SDR family NAD(P)-dependent oxidoreductase [unclassified Streptomyces]|uniref:SDR family NAD(P)-dependent oxidoreductase n=1 Tax=unclassified Streptomyces TaxID=2593676 RepID=UPI002E2F0F2B|nr:MULTISPECIES: SDR family NAD(P)-dependent oxidoreductase [unclassified Streptomyces]WUC63607.1 SDR family NAD(P)-dependent oxidoreductase [Streptomyces sp. NBC_00539]